VIFAPIIHLSLEEQILTLQDRKQSLIDSVMPFICKQLPAGTNQSSSL
jgi:hypothetical protein